MFPADDDGPDDDDWKDGKWGDVEWSNWNRDGHKHRYGRCPDRNSSGYSGLGQGWWANKNGQPEPKPTTSATASKP
ncbi:hypothetical protein OEZ86_008537 [Tetradesmus obliquus]|nr:hypothetical protein OEZ86_008537 [Tetradesmus obliquus]